MSSDNAIERLRALLDERGVKHVGNGGMVRWTNESGCVCRAYSRPGHLTVDVAIMDASPAQAIAATLGNDGAAELQAENAKLRELVKYAYECAIHSNHATCDDCERMNGCCILVDRMRELGIEVDA